MGEAHGAVALPEGAGLSEGDVLLAWVSTVQAFYSVQVDHGKTVGEKSQVVEKFVYKRRTKRHDRDMPPSQRIRIVPGLAMPFFPARPSMGVPATKKLGLCCFIADMDRGYVVQPKLNGDRACLGIVERDGGNFILVQNRHGSWLTQKIKNVGSFVNLGAGTCLDGEVVDGQFYPFEVLAWGGESFMGDTGIVREKLARIVCREAGVPYLFKPPTPKYVRRGFANLPRFEGWVSKDPKASYDLMSSATQESSSWVKYRWA